MPFVVVDLAAIVAAIVATLFGLAAYVLVKAIASGLPNISVVGVGLKFKDWFNALADPIENWIINNVRGLWGHVGQLLHATAWLFSTTFGAVVDAVEHAGDQVAHIVTVEIPNAILSAETAAAKHAEELVKTVGGDILTARHDLSLALGKAERAIYERSAEIAAHIADNIKAAVSHGVDEAESYVDREIHALRATLNRAIATAKADVESDLHTAVSTLTRSVSSLSDTVARDYNNALQAASADAAAALNTAKGLISQGVSEAEGVASADLAKVQASLQAAIDAVSGTVTSLTSTVGADLTAAENYATSQVAAGLSDVVNTLSGAADVVGGAIGAAAGAVAGEITGVADQAQADATAAVGDATTAIGQALDSVYGDLTGQALAYNGDLSSVEGLLAGAITGAIAGVVARVATLEKCAVSNCEGSPNNFSNLLNDALGLLDFGLLAPFLATVITDPSADAAEYVDTVGTFSGSADQLFDQLLGIMG